MPNNQDDVLDRIRSHAFTSIPPSRRETTNLYLDRRPKEKGEVLGPSFQNITAEETAILVFADDEPLANFGHRCRYLLYHPTTARLVKEIPARFPPYLNKVPETFEAFHEPIRVQPVSSYHVPPILRCPILIPRGNRYAVLYSGMSNLRHLNDLEFCYRTLLDRYGFDPANIYVLNYDGTLDTQNGIPNKWPGDGTAYRIKVTGQGNRSGFQAALQELKGKLKSDDTLFIHTNNHGDNSNNQSFLCAYPNWGVYWANDFCSDLGSLPAYQSLLVMMEQCNSGGFNAPVLASSTAKNTSIASAAIASQSSYASPDGNWDSFARDWIAAQAGHDPYGASLASNPDTDGDGVIEAEEAFSYALSVQNPSDSPNYNESSEPGGDIALGQQYILWWWWCILVLPILEKQYYGKTPDPAFYAKLHKVTPELQRLLVPMLDLTATDTRKKVASKIESIVETAFAEKN
jgi:Peptidase C13 family